MISKNVLCVVIDKATKNEIHSFEFSIDVNPVRIKSGWGMDDVMFRAVDMFRELQKYQKSLRNQKNWYVDCCFLD